MAISKGQFVFFKEPRDSQSLCRSRCTGSVGVDVDLSRRFHLGFQGCDPFQPAQSCVSIQLNRASPIVFGFQRHFAVKIIDHLLYPSPLGETKKSYLHSEIGEQDRPIRTGELGRKSQAHFWEQC